MTGEVTKTRGRAPAASARSAEHGSAAAIFNSTIAACALAALDELGYLDQLAQRGSISTPQFCASNGLHDMSFRSLVHAAACVDVVTVDGDTVRPGPGFDDLLVNKGYFLWLVRGYGGMMRELATITKESGRVGDFIDRDGPSIAVAGKDYGARFVDADFAAALAVKDFTSAADLGCGSGQRLIRLAQERPDFRGVGVEFDAGAAENTRARVHQMGLSDRITIVRGDVSKLRPEPLFADIDIVFSFFMAHDLWPRQRCIESLDGVARAFPRTKRFLLCDTYRSDLPPTAEVPIFTLGFEVTHAAMGQRVPSLQEWLDLFADTVWTLADQYAIGIPFSCIFDLRRDIA
jgi:SAM-dependent methyltransferase